MNTRSGAKVGTVDGTGHVGTAGLVGSVYQAPASGVPMIGAVALNVTVAEVRPPIGGGYVTVYPCGTRPDASNPNFTAGQTIPNASSRPSPLQATICFYVYGTAHLFADVSGYFPTTNVVRFKVVDEAGSLLSPSGLLYCDLAVSTVQNGECNPPASAASQSPDGFIRVALAPDKTYRINSFVTGTGWPCPWISPTGQTFHFSPPFESLGSSLPGLSTLTIVKPTPSAC